MMQYPAPGILLLLSGVLVAFLCLTGCEEDVAGPTGVAEPFSLYGVFNPRLPMQTVLVGPVEDLLLPESGSALDAVVTSTDLGSGTTYVWRDSVVANATGQLDHIYWADFTPEYGSRHRMEVVRSDGEKTVVNVEVPKEVRIEDEDAGTRDLHVRVLGLDDEPFSLVRIETVYDVSFYHVENPDTVCTSSPRRSYAISHKGIEEKTDRGWEFTTDMNLLYETLEMVRKNWTVFFVFLSVLSRRVMPPGSAVFVCRIRRRGFGCQVPGEAALR